MSDTDILGTDFTWAGVQRVAATPKPPEFFADRNGYLASFLGEGYEVPLPEFAPAFSMDEISHLEDESFVLKYQNFSAVQSKLHRQPVYSACNIHGGLLKSIPRHDTWSYDGRIPKEHQMLREAYGPQDDKKFSRGHMTRRQDPNWGDLTTARKANIDTFIATNASPQWQPFNDGIWGDLEDYVLDNANGEDKLVSVFTGPFFDNAEVRFGVTVPRDFWKVIAFISEETQELAAVAYMLSQGEYLDSGIAGDPINFNDKAPASQISIEQIEGRTPLRFGILTECDVLAGAGVMAVKPIRRLSDTKLPSR